jgi:hypothetical protein
VNNTAIDNIHHILLYNDQKGFKECIAFPLNAIEWQTDETRVIFTVNDGHGNPHRILRRKPAGFDEVADRVDFVILDLSLPTDKQLVALAEGSTDALGFGVTIDTVHLMPN